MNEFQQGEKYIDQYEHIKKLELLTDAELAQIKKKRKQFEVSIRNNNSEAKSFIEFIKFELLLMKKFKQMEYENENDRRALDRAISINVQSIFRQMIRQFQSRNLWRLYLKFTKSKFPNTMTGIYQEMLHYHHTKDDYIEAVKYEICRDNYGVALTFLMQAMAKEKDSVELVALHIECSLKQAEKEGDENFKEKSLLQVSKLFSKFIKDSKEIQVHLDLLKNIQKFKFALSFQNDVLTNLLRYFSDHAETWNLLAERHLDGLFYGDSDKTDDDEVKPFEIRLQRALTLYEKSFEIVENKSRKQMYDFYITKLLELDQDLNINDECYKHIRRALGKAFKNGNDENNLSEEHFTYYVKLCIAFTDGSKKNSEKLLQKSKNLFPNSMQLYELTMKYYLKLKDYDKVAKIFNHAISHNDKKATELYKFLIEIYLKNPKEKERIRNAMMEAIKSSDKELSANFQPYFIEFCAINDGIDKAREIYSSLLKSKSVVSLSLEFYRMMIRMEQQQQRPNNKIITNCFERAIEMFGSDSTEIWLDYTKHFWAQEKFSDATNLRRRAIENMKRDLAKVNEFELKLTMLRNESGLEVDGMQ